VFGSLGWLEVVTLLVVAVLVFGPDKLPSMVRDAAAMLRQLRSLAQGARSQLKSELGPEFADFDLDSLNPKTFVRKHLLEDSDDDTPDGYSDGYGDTNRANGARRPGSSGPAQAPLAEGERAPYDPDTT
jgi:sec-independent protein translocase protein TatB